MINKQLHCILEGQYDNQLAMECKHCMDEVAHTIYRTGYKRYFTTNQGKLQFHFYLNISYINIKLKLLDNDYHNKLVENDEMNIFICITDKIDSFFKRECKRDEVLKEFTKAFKNLEIWLNENDNIVYFIKLLYKNFLELDELDYKNKDVPYVDWERTNYENFCGRIREDFSMKSMRFNFAVRLAVILSLSLLIAHLLGFYKMIWAIIPIMSVTRPYFEETMERKKDRLQSNLLACILVGIIINVINIEWFSVLLMIIGFYFVYAFKDYYRMSFFITLISMSLSSFGKSINELIFYRLIYLVVGILIVEISVRIIPFKLEDGMKELIKKIMILRERLENEYVLSKDGKENQHIIRMTIIHSELLSQHIKIKNKAIKDEKITDLINENSEFVIEIGHQLLVK